MMAQKKHGSIGQDMLCDSWMKAEEEAFLNFDAAADWLRKGSVSSL